MIIISNDTTYPIFTDFLTFDISTFSLKPDPQLWYELPFCIAVALLLLISAAAHLSLAAFGYKRKVGPCKDYLFGERVYIILILLAKTALAWQIFAGTLAPV